MEDGSSRIAHRSLLIICRTSAIRSACEVVCDQWWSRPADRRGQSRAADVCLALLAAGWKLFLPPTASPAGRLHPPSESHLAVAGLDASLKRMCGRAKQPIDPFLRPSAAGIDCRLDCGPCRKLGSFRPSQASYQQNLHPSCVSFDVRAPSTSRIWCRPSAHSSIHYPFCHLPCPICPLQTKSETLCMTYDLPTA